MIAPGLNLLLRKIRSPNSGRLLATAGIRFDDPMFGTGYLNICGQHENRNVERQQLAIRLRERRTGSRPPLAELPRRKTAL